MDFLASLHLDDLPEQQTRAAHLSQKLAKDPEMKLGFNACPSCGVSIGENPVHCPHCQRVSYCSEKCRVEDTRPPMIDEAEGALGHSSIICSLLKLCNDDEEADNNNNEAAQDRVRSELESYPATMANILREGPCYEEFLSNLGGSSSTLTIHVIGASHDGELWNGNGYLQSYTEALLQLAEDFGFSEISLYMIGPECPENKVQEERSMPYERNSSKSYTLELTTQQSLYTADLVQEIGKPNIVVFFNPGFTCPDYTHWEETMQLLEYDTMAFLSTTNTEMEGVSDCNFLMNDCKLLPHMPPLAAEIMGIEGYGDKTFFAENPYAGSRVRQSGTMGNDVFVKNRWMIGGVLAKPEKKRAVEEEDDVDAIEYEARGNSKRTNPALI